MPANSQLIDANITLGQCPMRCVPCDQIDKLVAKLRAHHVAEAWAGHYDGLFHTDLTSVNNRLAETCRRTANRKPTKASGELRLVPFGEINPLALNWEAELDRCVTVHHMRGIRLHPSYHHYKLDDPKFAALLKAAAERRLIVQLVVLMEDARMMHPLMRVPTVDLGPLEKLLPKTPNVRLVLLNAASSPTRTDLLSRLAAAGEVYIDIAMLETIAGVETLVKDFPVPRILFGSHAPSFYFESAMLKLQESNLPSGHLRAISHETARGLLTPT